MCIYVVYRYKCGNPQWHNIMTIFYYWAVIYALFFTQIIEYNNCFYPLSIVKDKVNLRTTKLIFVIQRWIIYGGVVSTESHFALPQVI